MEKFKWITTSSWIDETINFFNNTKETDSIVKIKENLKNGIYFEGKKNSSCERIFSEINQKYIKDTEIFKALHLIINSEIEKTIKKQYLLFSFYKDENLRSYFISDYIYPNYIKKQKTYTQRDLDIFFEELMFNKKNRLPPKFLSDGISDASMKKARNQLFKFLEDFGWAEKNEEKIILKKPTLSPEWFVFGLYFYYKEKIISIEDVIKDGYFKKFLMDEYDIDYMLNQANQNKLIEVYKMGDIRNITKIKGDTIYEYAGYIIGNS